MHHVCQRDPRVALTALVLVLSGLNVGCGTGGSASPMSPAVGAESEAGVKARAQDQQLREERRRQEAQLRRHRPNIPAGE